MSESNDAVVRPALDNIKTMRRFVKALAIVVWAIIGLSVIPAVVNAVRTGEPIGTERVKDDIPAFADHLDERGFQIEDISPL